MKAGTMPALFLVISQMSGRVLFSEYHEPRFGTVNRQGIQRGEAAAGTQAPSSDEVERRLEVRWGGCIRASARMNVQRQEKGEAGRQGVTPELPAQAMRGARVPRSLWKMMTSVWNPVRCLMGCVRGSRCSWKNRSVAQRHASRKI